MGIARRAGSVFPRVLGAVLLLGAGFPGTSYAQGRGCSTPETNACYARCTQNNAAARSTCRELCDMRKNSCERSIKDAAINIPDNANNPLTRLYPNVSEMIKDPKYPAAYQKWKSCLFRNGGAGGSADDYRFCKKLDPKNSIRR